MGDEAKKSENTTNSEKEQQEAVKKIYTFAMEEVKAGADKTMLSEKLVGMGVDKAAADEIYDQFMKHAEQEKYSRSSIIRGLTGGVIAAAIGGAIWGLLVIVTKYEIGFVAWGVGGLAGYAVVLAVGGKKGVPLQIIAVSCAVLGIIVGKYFTYYNFLTSAATELYGAEVASRISLFSGGVVSSFFKNIGLLMGPYDLLWFGFAIYTAWRIPRSIGLKLPRQAG